MPFVDRGTLEYYEANAGAVFARHWSVTRAIDVYFRTAFPEGSRVLDLGAGSGRDLVRLLDLGYDASGVEPSRELRRLAVERCPRLADRLVPGSLPDALPDLEPFDGVVCSAVLMHLPPGEQFDSLLAVRRLLRPNGRFLVSLPLEPGAGSGAQVLTTGEHRDRHGRLRTRLVPDALSLLAERLGMQRIGRWIDADSTGRDRTWSTQLFERTGTGPLRPLDQIEGVLNRDRKFATYKLALFRALCDIARTSYRAVRWRPDGTVAVPLRLIAEHWLRYYWPLVDAERFVPQRRGETRGGPKPIAFRPLLEELAGHYRRAGGLDRFLADRAAGAVPAPAREVHARLLRKIAGTIRSGPVTYAGGSLETGRLFGKARGEVIVPGGIWREVCLTGHWIQDALVLRWAELTSEISAKRVAVSEVLELLLPAGPPERDVALARKVYAGLPEIDCVWSGRSLRRGFDVDHVLPHSIWRSNALWNLMPASPPVNRAKGDRLPRHRLLVARRCAIERYWDALESETPRRFESEAGVLAGVARPGRRELFDALVEAVEVTALQRGCERWSPD